MLKVQRAANLAAKREAFPHQIPPSRRSRTSSSLRSFMSRGLGKTKIGLDLALSWPYRDIVDSVMIVTKKGLIENWRGEIASHSHLSPRVIGQDRNANFYAFNSPARLYLAHYEAIVSERKRLELFLKTRRVAVILDEAHKIKNPESEIAEAALAISQGFKRRVIMTGTPVANRPYDLWAQIRFLDGGEALGDSFASFKRSLDLANDLGRDEGRRRALCGRP